MAGLNKVMLIGNLGKDPEVKTLDNGAKIATFPLATSENYKDKDGNRQTRTEWHNLVLWRGLADIAENYLHKGSQVFVEGRLSTRKWEDKEGHTRYTTEVIGDNLVLLNRAGEGNSQNAQSNAGGFGNAYPASRPGNDDLMTDAADDLPF
jgi:single-strand DNA-binding protein